MKNILVIGTTDNRGGAAQVGWQIGNNLPKDKYSVKFLVSQKYSGDSRVIGLDNPNTFSLSSLYRHFRTFISGNDIDWGHGTDILSHPWYLEADLIHCHNLHGNYFNFSKLIDIANEKPLVWTLHDEWALLGDVAYGRRESIMEYPPMLFQRSKYLLNKKLEINRQIKGNIVCPSQWLYEEAKNYQGFANSSVVYINNGIDLSLFKPTPKINKKSGFGIFIGSTHDSRKGWQYIQALLSQQQSIKIVVAGDGGMDTKQVKYLGHLTQKELVKWINKCDYMLAPSLYENASLSIMQALACGVPVVAFNSGGISEQIVHKNTGYLSDVNNITQLEEGIVWVNQQDKGKISSQCRAFAINNFDQNTMVAKYDQLYSSLI